MTIAGITSMSSDIWNIYCSDIVADLAHMWLLTLTAIPPGPCCHSHLTQTETKDQSFAPQDIPCGILPLIHH